MKNEDSKLIDEYIQRAKHIHALACASLFPTHKVPPMFSIGDEVTVIKDDRPNSIIPRQGETGIIIGFRNSFDELEIKNKSQIPYFQNLTYPIARIKFSDGNNASFPFYSIAQNQSTPEPTCTCQSLLWGHSRDCFLYKPER